jgi:hypothetical protein
MIRLATPRRHKYNAKKTVIDGIAFDSKAEARRYQELLLLQRAGEISDLELQPKFLLQAGFTDNTGKRQRAIHYIADFQYVENDQMIIEEVKGYKKNAVWRLKKKMFLYHHPNYKLRIVE